MLAETLESVQFSPSKRTMYARCVVTALAISVLLKTCWFARWGFWQHREFADFDAFHTVAQRVWLGDLELVYRLETFVKLQMDASVGTTGLMPWTYPPQFDLLLAPFALLPVEAAYLVFTAATLVFYLMALRALAGSYFAQVLIILFPALAITIGSGQNGFLTGALIGLVCLHARKRPVLAGLALGAMVIKPHLAIAVAVYLLATRQWRAIATAAVVVLASTLLCTLIFGPQIWIAFLGAVRESASYLDQGFYPMFRMISSYAALRTAGVSSTVAFWSQAIVAGLALAAVVVAVARGLSAASALGVSVMVSVMISPYAYDYDLPMVGIGLALLLPDLAGMASPRERGVMYGLIMLAGCYGLLQTARMAAQYGQRDQHFAPAVAGLAVIALLALLLRILLRKASPVPATSSLGSEPAEVSA
jgi:hypothetical protein